MQGLRVCAQWLSTAGISMSGKSLLDAGRVCGVSLGSDFHTTSIARKHTHRSKPSHWEEYNRKIFPVQTPDEPRRPAYVCHMKSNIRYSPSKMWYVAILVRGMSVDEAIKQLSFVSKKGAAAVKETILEAQDLAVKKHNVEFKSNLWVAESFCGKGLVYKGYRRHARSRVGEVRYTFCHYYVRLEEGSPPENYYLPAPKGKQEMLDEWLQQMRSRKITSTL